MFALVESGSITKLLSGNKGITIDGVQHPRAIFTLWTEAERNAIGIYTVEIDKSKKKDEQWYVNTNITYTCLLYTSPSPQDVEESRMPSSA